MRSPPKRRFYQLEKFLKFIEDLRNIGFNGPPSSQILRTPDVQRRR
jgi:hypothetical protein